jgi:hypothetical protein
MTSAASGRAEGRAGLWLRWVLANAAGEAVGLGATALAAYGLFVALGTDEGLLPALAFAALAVLAGATIEGSVVGTAQWAVLRRLLPALRWRTWALATAVGALVAWTLGMVPSTALSLGAGPSGDGAPAAESGAGAVYGLAFLMGLVLGPVLGFAQWLVLRRYFENAGLWMPANSLAWAFGMVVVFVGVDAAAPGASASGVAVPAAVLLAALALAGAVVGAVHGAVLVWMLRPPPGTARPGGRKG